MLSRVHAAGPSSYKFTPAKLQPCSWILRQKFREHEILDDISRLRYEGQLPDMCKDHSKPPHQSNIRLARSIHVQKR